MSSGLDRWRSLRARLRPRRRLAGLLQRRPRRLPLPATLPLPGGLRVWITLVSLGFVLAALFSHARALLQLRLDLQGGLWLLLGLGQVPMIRQNVAIMLPLVFTTLGLTILGFHMGVESWRLLFNWQRLAVLLASANVLDYQD